MGFIPYGFVQKPTGIFVEPQQAKIVRQIYQRYLEGDSLEGIADFLFQEGIPSPQGKERWTRPVINNLLSNQKYISHIIDFGSFFMVQGEKGRRSNIDEDTGKRRAARYSSQNVLSGFLFARSVVPTIDVSPALQVTLLGAVQIVWSMVNESASTPPLYQRRASRRSCAEDWKWVAMMNGWLQEP